jgi:hypothetical protein
MVFPRTRNPTRTGNAVGLGIVTSRAAKDTRESKGAASALQRAQLLSCAFDVTGLSA